LYTTTRGNRKTDIADPDFLFDRQYIIGSISTPKSSQVKSSSLYELMSIAQVLHNNMEKF